MCKLCQVISNLNFLRYLYVARCEFNDDTHRTLMFNAILRNKSIEGVENGARLFGAFHRRFSDNQLWSMSAHCNRNLECKLH